MKTSWNVQCPTFYHTLSKHNKKGHAWEYLLSYFCPHTAGEFLFTNLYILSQLGEKYAYFTPIGEKICIFPLFFPFQSFVSFFITNLYVISQLGEKYAYFLTIGEKICIPPPLFLSSFNNFFLPTCYFTKN